MSVPVPIIAGGGIGYQHGISKKAGVPPTSQNQGCVSMNRDEFTKAAQVIQDAELREKVASTMLQLNDALKGHEKRAHAIKMLFKKAELGLDFVPSTYSEFEQKVASLASQDLAVLEKAMELSAGEVKLGELASTPAQSEDAAVKFQSSIVEL